LSLLLLFEVVLLAARKRREVKRVKR